MPKKRKEKMIERLAETGDKDWEYFEFAANLKPHFIPVDNGNMELVSVVRVYFCRHSNGSSPSLEGLPISHAGCGEHYGRRRSSICYK